MKEEELFQKIGKENPFSTPDGYFENLTSNVMEHLPEKELPKGPEQVTLRTRSGHTSILQQSSWVRR